MALLTPARRLKFESIRASKLFRQVRWHTFGFFPICVVLCVVTLPFTRCIAAFWPPLGLIGICARKGIQSVPFSLKTHMRVMGKHSG
jgi:hypothetical protein